MGYTHTVASLPAHVDVCVMVELAPFHKPRKLLVVQPSAVLLQTAAAKVAGGERARGIPTREECIVPARPCARLPSVVRRTVRLSRQGAGRTHRPMGALADTYPIPRSVVTAREHRS